VNHTVRMPDGQGSTSRPGTRSAQVAQRAEITRAALVAAARRLFVEKGYFATGTEEIVSAAGVGTRGALYHHFADKRALFEAVFEAVEEDLIVAAAGTELPTGALAQLRAGLLGFLDASLTREVQQVLLLDGPAVLGWEQWRALEERYGLGAIRALLEQAVSEGTMPAQPLDVVAHLLLASVDEAALFIANSTEPEAAKEQALEVVDRLLTGVTSPAPKQRARKSKRTT
jgi:AcrR family transcriptional regulator